VVWCGVVWCKDWVNGIRVTDPGSSRTAFAPLELRRSIDEVVFLFIFIFSPEGAQYKSPGRSFDHC